MRIILLLTIGFLWINTDAQHKFTTPCVILEGNFKTDSLIPAGYPAVEFPVRQVSKDTLTNTIIQFKSSIGSVAVCEIQLAVKEKIILQYQVNTFDKINTSNLVDLCSRYFGKAIKTMQGVKSAMYYWSHVVNEKEIHTVLITARGGKKGELISWIVTV